MIAPDDHPHGGKLLCPYGFGVVLSEITRKQFESTDLGEVLPAHLVVCRDEMIEGIEAEQFQERLWAMFNVQFPHVLTLPQMDRIRWHMFPELRVSQRTLFDSGSTSGELPSAGEFLRIMDLQQERLARSLGEGHRVIHGVAGSGRTLILGYRCEQLAKTTSAPILVLCFNVTLAAKLEQIAISRGLGSRVTVRNFHRWCLDQLSLYHVPKPQEGKDFFSSLVASVQQGVERGQIPRAQYGAVLIDEGHDFEADWLTLITQMIDPTSNSLLLLYDDAQSIYARRRPAGFSFKRVGVQAQGRTTILRINYRNTDDIQRCAYEFAKEVLTPTSSDDDGVPLIKPEMAGRRGPKPSLIRLSSLKAEAALVASQFKKRHEAGTPWNQMAALYSARFIAEELIAELTSKEIPFQWLGDRSSKRFDPAGDSVKVITLHSSKGLEFAMVAILGLGYMPYGEADAVDEARLLYVGMTRATDELLMTASRDSEFARRLMMIQKVA